MAKKLTQLGRSVVAPALAGRGEAGGGAQSACRYGLSSSALPLRNLRRLCPVTGQPDFAHFVIDYVPGKSIVEFKSLKLSLAELSQSRRLPRGLHARHRQAGRGGDQAEISAHRRLLVSARRNPDRCLLADRKIAVRCVAAGHGCRALSRSRLMPVEIVADHAADKPDAVEPHAGLHGRADAIRKFGR